MRALVLPHRLLGAFEVPPSKSHAARALLLSAFARGESRIEGFARPGSPSGGDSGAALRAARAFGAEVLPQADGSLLVRGNGGEPPASGRIDCGNSGTMLYFCSALAALASGEWILDGDAQTRGRPALPLLAALRTLGAEAEGSGPGGGFAPLRLRGPLASGGGGRPRVRLESPTSQYLSALLLALPFSARGAELELSLLNERPYVGMTLSWLARAGLEALPSGGAEPPVGAAAAPGGPAAAASQAAPGFPAAAGGAGDPYSRFLVPGGQTARPFRSRIPADWSAAAFLLAAGAAGGGPVEVQGLSSGDGQGDEAILGMLRAFGAEVSLKQDLREEGDGQGRGLVAATVSRSGPLRPVDLDLNATPDLLPVLAALAALVPGRSVFRNVPQARIKETDRIAAMAAALGALGARTEELPDGLAVEGPLGSRPATRRGEGGPRPLAVDSYGDHRVAMALAVLGLGAPFPLAIDQAESAAVSYPGFWEAIGAELPE